jgi:hypothetical protein
MRMLSTYTKIFVSGLLEADKRDLSGPLSYVIAALAKYTSRTDMPHLYLHTQIGRGSATLLMARQIRAHRTWDSMDVRAREDIIEAVKRAKY